MDCLFKAYRIYLLVVQLLLGAGRCRFQKSI